MKFLKSLRFGDLGVWAAGMGSILACSAWPRQSYQGLGGGCSAWLEGLIDGSVSGLAGNPCPGWGQAEVAKPSRRGPCPSGRVEKIQSGASELRWHCLTSAYEQMFLMALQTNRGL